MYPFLYFLALRKILTSFFTSLLDVNLILEYALTCSCDWFLGKQVIWHTGIFDACLLLLLLLLFCFKLLS
jgi:hypothetical protein